MKNFIQYIKKPLLCSIPFLIIWLLLLDLISFVCHMGVLAELEYVYGKYIYIVLFVIGILVFTSVIYLRFFIKRELYIQLTAIFTTIIFIFLLYLVEMNCDKAFSEFSTEKFINYPGHRLTMYYDFIDKYGYKGYSYDDIETLLGKPDKSTDTSWVYCDGYGNRISVTFENGKSVSMQYSE